MEFFINESPVLFRDLWRRMYNLWRQINSGFLINVKDEMVSIHHPFACNCDFSKCKFKRHKKNHRSMTIRRSRLFKFPTGIRTRAILELRKISDRQIQHARKLKGFSKLFSILAASMTRMKTVLPLEIC